MTLAYPERLALARTPTPLEFVERTSAELGVEIWFKRDDLTGAPLTGNKVRKLEYLLSDALSKRADTLITCGGEQSNHCRATAVAAARLGLSCVLLLRTVDPKNPPPITANILLDRMVGADIRWISHDDWRNRHSLMAAVADEVRGAEKEPYVIPEGGSNAVGSWGYLRAAEELANDLADLPERATSIVYACGSGGTGAGLVLGRKLTRLSQGDVRVSGINVCDDRDYFLTTITGICTEFSDRFGIAVNVTPRDIDILDGHVGDGYAKSRPEELADIVALSKREGIILDPVYGGKAWHGLLEELKSNRERFGERIVFLHTGGIFGVFPAARAIDQAIG
jgi:D-cysteine desulfhydrase